MAVHRLGNGPEHVLAFHGFGRTGRDFAAFMPALADRYTIHAFDLPFHGRSPAPEGTAPISPAEWEAYMRAYAGHLRTGPVGLMGHSLGGRLALVLLERCPDLLRQVFLLAPDGLAINPWFRRMVRYAWGRALGRAFIRHPGPVHGSFRLLLRLHLLDGRLYRFLMDQTATPEVRRLVFNVWNGTRLLEPDLARVAGNVRAKAIPVHLLLGLHDRVIRPAQGKRLLRLAPGQVHLHMLPAGHRLMDKATGAFLATLSA